ncbi:MAG TPA: GNAT family N-acetyltransferase [Acidimicrobiales bacterium]|nr:GNAT family N-acetyltransferase [Acidimicrobiales bacterium]
MRTAPRWPIHTGRLVLRPLTGADLDALVAYRSLPEVCRYVPFEPMDAEAICERLRSTWVRRTLDAEGQYLTIGVELAEGGSLVGDLHFRWTSEQHRSGEIGYVFHPAVAGRGYATEAAHGLLHLAFDELAFHRVTARVDVRNGPSARVARRLGMREEARLLENEWFKGEWAGEVDFAILEREWRALHEDGCPDLRVDVPSTRVTVVAPGHEDLRAAVVAIYDRPIGVRLLYRHPLSGAEHYLVRYPPGLVAATHRHTAAHTFVVLEGALEVDGERLGPGSYCHFPAGSEMHHAPAGHEGCLFVAMFDGPQDVEPVTGDGPR